MSVNIFSKGDRVIVTIPGVKRGPRLGTVLATPRREQLVTVAYDGNKQDRYGNSISIDYVNHISSGTLMSDIGVFHANEFNSTFFTRCCEVAITNREESCPGCGKKVIPAKDRWECAAGAKHRAVQLAWREKYRASGQEQAGRVAARLEGKPYVMPALCLMCGKPVDKCYC